MIWFVKYKLKMIKLEIQYHLMLLRNPHIKLKSKLKYILKEIVLRHCGRCGGKAYLEHSNCAYVNELSNYNFCCKDCHEEINEHYQELWDEYYSGRL